MRRNTAASVDAFGGAVAFDFEGGPAIAHRRRVFQNASDDCRSNALTAVFGQDAADVDVAHTVCRIQQRCSGRFAASMGQVQPDLWNVEDSPSKFTRLGRIAETSTHDICPHVVLACVHDVYSNVFRNDRFSRC